MFKKILIVSSVIAIILTPSIALAATWVHLDYIGNIPPQDGRVYKYRDGDNTCYLAKNGVYGGASVSISCVRGN